MRRDTPYKGMISRPRTTPTIRVTSGRSRIRSTREPPSAIAATAPIAISSPTSMAKTTVFLMTTSISYRRYFKMATPTMMGRLRNPAMNGTWASHAAGVSAPPSE